MAEGMDVETAPAIRDKKRFEVKKVGMSTSARVRVWVRLF